MAVQSGARETVPRWRERSSGPVLDRGLPTEQQASRDRAGAQAASHPQQGSAPPATTAAGAASPR